MFPGVATPESGQDPLNWLLEPETPAVRHATLRRLLDRPADDPEVVAEQQADARGRWRNEYAFNGKTWIDIERQGDPSKWVTLRAAAAEPGRPPAWAAKSCSAYPRAVATRLAASPSPRLSLP
jgi:hypothetical protein